MPRLVVLPISPGGGGGGGGGTGSGSDCIDPTIGSFASRVYEAMEPIQFLESRLCWPFKKYVGALGEIYQEADDIARDGPPWSSVLDIDRCPDYALLWLAQFVGVRVPN